MGKENCFNQLRAAKAFKEIDDDTLKGLVGDLDKLYNNSRRSIPKFKEKSESQRAKLLKERVLRRIEFKENLIKFEQASNVVLNQPDIDSVNALKGFLAGGNEGRSVELNRGIPQIEDTHFNKLANILLKMNKPDLEILKSGELRSEIAAELWNFKSGSQPATTNKTAFRIAQHLHIVQNEMLKLRQFSGSLESELRGYIMKTTHLRDKISAAGQAKWIESAKSRLDLERSFGDNADKADEILEKIYNNIVNGKFDESVGSFLSGDLSIKGTNIATKLSQSRKLHFKSSDDLLGYLDEFGNGDLFDVIIQTVKKTARDAAVMEKLGTNPSRTFDRLKGKIKSELRDKPAELSKFLNEEKQIDDLFRLTTQSNISPERNLIAKATSVSKSIANLAFLGRVVATALPADTATGGGLIASSFGDVSGRGIFRSTFNVFSEMFSNLKPGNSRRELAEFLGQGIEDYVNADLTRFNLGNEMGSLSKAQRTFFRLTGLAQETSAVKVTMAKLISKELAGVSEVAFDSLPSRTKSSLLRFGINEAEWEIARLGVAEYPLTPMGGFLGSKPTRGITQEAIEGLDDELIQGVLTKFGIEESTDKFKRGVGNKIGSMFVDFGLSASNTADFRSRQTLGAVTDPNTIAGAFIRTFAQFKGPTLQQVKTISRIINNNPTKGGQRIRDVFKGKSDVDLLLSYIGGLTVAGYTTMILKDIADGKEPRQPTPETIEDAFLLSGGAGLYGDFLLGFGDVKDKLFNFAAGPVGSTVFKLANDGSKLFNPKNKTKTDKLARNVARDLFSVVPFQNLIFTKAATDRLFKFNMLNAFDPKFFDRLEKRSDFLVPPDIFDVSRDIRKVTRPVTRKIDKIRRERR